MKAIAARTRVLCAALAVVPGSPDPPSWVGEAYEKGRR